MKKVFLALKNEIVRNVITKSGLFEISNNSEINHDICFCDTLELGSSINASLKIYIASNYFEYLDNPEKYQDYSYFIGFGKFVYDKLLENLNFIPSEVFDGFLYDQEVEKEINDNFIVLNLKNNFKNNEKSFRFCDLISKDFYTLMKDTKFTQYFNHPIPERLRTNSYHWYNEISNSMLSNCFFLLTDSLMNCRLYFNHDILTKTIISSCDFDLFNQLSEKTQNMPIVPSLLYSRPFSVRNKLYKQISSDENQKQSFIFFKLMRADINQKTKEQEENTKKINREKKLEIITMNTQQEINDIKNINDLNNDDFMLKQNEYKAKSIANLLRYQIFVKNIESFSYYPIELHALHNFTKEIILKEYLDNFEEICQNPQDRITAIPDVTNQFLTKLEQFA